MSERSDMLLQELEALRRGGKIFPSDVVQWAATHRYSMLHSCFEWDDKKASHAWRLQQARQLMIRIRIEGARQERAYVSLTVDRTTGGGYRPLGDVMRTANMREILLRDAVRELARVRERFQMVSELARIWEEIEKARKQYAPTEEDELV